MWFDGKSPDEIRERILKEGMWSKWLEDSEEDAEGIAEAEQEILNMEEDADDLLESATKHVLLPLLSGIRPPENTKEIKSSSIPSTRDKVGDVVLYLLAQAEISIFVTHFFRELYSEMYRAVQLEKIHQGVVFERIVEIHLEYSDDYEWLNDFHDEHGNPIKNYTEYAISTNRLFNFDFMIIDEKYVILAYRGYTSDDVLIFENTSMAQIFLNIWQNLKPQKDCEGNITDWRTTVTPNQRRRKG